MYRPNKSEQINIFDNAYGIDERAEKILKEEWPGYFRENIFVKIDEDKFSVLFSEKKSRPNTPVNIMVGLLILKELTGQTDDALMKSLIFDLRFQYALHTTSYAKQPISRNAFTNFRNNLIDYELTTGKDLYKEEIVRLSKEINKCCKSDTSLKRMDSMMISSACKKMSRIELAYKVNMNFIEKVKEIRENLLGERELKYFEEGFKKESVYETTKENHKEKLETLLKDTKMLYDKYKDNKDLKDTKEFELLTRMLKDQVKEDGTPRDSKDIKSDSLQNPSDEDATYRYKYEGNVGYVANVVEEKHENGEVYITDYEFDRNIHSDIEFMSEYIEKKEDNEKETMLVDAAYYSDKIKDKAQEKNVELIPTQTMGKKSGNTDIANFKVDEENHIVVECPNGEEPTQTKYNDETHKYSARFDKTKCEACPLRATCEKAGFIKKKVVSVSFSMEQYHKSKLELKMESAEYKKISDNRAGVEGTMSVLRRKYDVDNFPYRGLLRSKLGFGGCILSINIQKAIKYNKMRDKIALSNLNFLIFKFKWSFLTKYLASPSYIF